MLVRGLVWGAGIPSLLWSHSTGLIIREYKGLVCNNVFYRVTVQYILRQQRVSSISTNELTSLLLPI